MATANSTIGRVRVSQPASQVSSNSVTGIKVAVNQQNPQRVQNIQYVNSGSDAQAALSVANLAYGQANAAYDTGNASYSTANAAYATGNAAYVTANAAYTTANAAYVTANASYETGNASYSTANAAYVTANAAYTTANYSYITANAAFDSANTRVLKSGDTMTGTLVIANTTKSLSNTTGALIVNGGVGIAGNTFATGKLAIGDSINHPNVGAVFNVNSSSGTTAFRAITLIDTAANMKIVRLGVNDPAIELMKYDANLTNSSAYFDMLAGFTANSFTIRDRNQGNLYRFHINEKGYIYVGGGNVVPNAIANLHVSGNAFVSNGITTTIVNANSYIISTGFDVFLHANSAYNTVNSTILNTNSYITANSVADRQYTDARITSNVTSVFGQANASYAHANASYAHANAAYTFANTRYSANGGTIFGSVLVNQDLNVSGNLYVAGNVTTVSANDLVINDSILYIANNNTSNVIDIGFAGNFTQGIYQHTGFIRDASDGKWKLFSNVVPEPTTTVDFTNAIYDTLKVGTIEAAVANIAGYNLLGYTQSAYGQANSAYATGNASYVTANASYATANASYATGNAAYATANAAYAAANNVSPQVAPAFAQANAAYATANAAYLKANTMGTIAIQNANNIAVTGGYIDGTVIGANTAANGTFNTLIATGQASLGGAVGSESFRATVVASQNRYVEAKGGVAGSTYPAIGTGGGGEAFGVYSNLNAIRFTTNGYNNTTQLLVAHTTSAVNFVQITGAATGSAPVITSAGSDANVPLSITTKGIGIIYIGQPSSATTGRVDISPNGGPSVRFAASNTSVNYTEIRGAATGLPASMIARGSDTNVGLDFSSLNTGAIAFYGAGDYNAGTARIQASIVPAANSVNYMQISGAATGAGPQIYWTGSDANVVGVYNVKGAGAHLFATNGNGQFRVNDTASAVNYVQVAGAATTGQPLISAQGSDTNISLSLTSKGIGNVNFWTNNSGSRQFAVVNTTGTIVNYATATGSATGAPPVFSVAGTDTNIDLNLVTKGIGGLNVYTGTNPAFRVSDTGSTAVNFMTVINQSAGNGPRIRSEGSDTNINFVASSKGTGALMFYTNTEANRQVQIQHIASAVNYAQLQGSPTGGQVVLSAQGSDTNADLSIQTKGVGIMRLQSHSGTNIMRLRGSGTPVNYFDVYSSDTGSGPRFTVEGNDTNISNNIEAKGSGVVAFYTRGALQAYVTGQANAVNYLVLGGQTTANYPAISALGSDTNIGLDFFSKNAGPIRFRTGTDSNISFRVADTANTVNYIQVTGGVTNGSPIIGSQGLDANIELRHQTKGNWNHLFQDGSSSNSLVISQTGAATGAPTNYFTITRGASGTSPSLQATGTDANVDLVFEPKGTGTARVAANTQFAVFEIRNTSNAQNIQKVSRLQFRGTDSVGTVKDIGSITVTGVTQDHITDVVTFNTRVNDAVAERARFDTAGDFVVGNGSNTQFKTATTANAVNYVNVTGGIAGSPPKISSQGVDTNIDVNLSSKGAGWYSFFGNNFTNQLFQIQNAGVSSTNWVGVQSSVTGYPVSVSARGGDTNVGLDLNSKGTGQVRLSTGNGTGFTVSENGTTDTWWTAYGSVVSPVLEVSGANNNNGIIRTAGTGSLYFRTAQSLTQFVVGHSANAVNYITATGAATGYPVTLAAAGADTHVSFNIVAKGNNAVALQNSDGSGAFGVELGSNALNDRTVFIDLHTSLGSDYDYRLLRNPGVNGNIIYTNAGSGHHYFSGNANNQFMVATTPTAVNYLQVTGSTATNPATMTVSGADTNSSIQLTAKGSGNIITNVPTHVGTYAGNTQVLFENIGGAGNAMRLKTKLYRHTNGSDWTGVATRIQQTVDVTDQAYVEFNPMGVTFGLALVTPGSQPVQFKTGNGVEQFRVGHTSSSVNFGTVTGSTTGSPTGVIFSVSGSDVNANIAVASKGTGSVNLNTGGGTQVRVFDTFGGGTANNYMGFQGRSSGRPIMFSEGTETDIPILVAAKGSGTITFRTGGIYGQDQHIVIPVANAVNYVATYGSVTGVGPTFAVGGSDTNIDLNLVSKGTGGIAFNTGNGVQARVLDSSAGPAVNYVYMKGSATGGVEIGSNGSETNIPLFIGAKNAGRISFYQGGSEQVRITQTASSVNYLNFTGSATSGAVTLSAMGSDAGINISYATKGTYASHIFTGTQGNQFQVTGPANGSYGVNRMIAYSAVSGTGPTLGTTGSDSNIDLNLSASGTGVVKTAGTFVAGLISGGTF